MILAAASPRAGCPKAMVYGPCQGVHADGACELRDRRCVFVDDAAPPRHPDVPASAAEGPAARQWRDLAARRPLVLAELPTEDPTPDGQRRVAEAVAGAVDGALLGDAPWSRVQLPPSVRARIVAEAGVRPVAGLTCRDRNRVALEGELGGLRDAGAGMVLCLTGDHPRLGERADAAAVFDLDSTRLAALATRFGMIVAVGESPSAPPVAHRPARLASKAAAGATVCIVNHARSLAEIEDFVAAAAALAPHVSFVVSVPLAPTDRGRRRLAAFFPDGVADSDAAVGAEGEAGRVRAAVGFAERALAIPGVIGVDLSTAGGPGEEREVAAALATAGRALGGGS